MVGASRVRDVDDEWPAVGAKIHHSVGAWPLLIDDHTEVLEALPNSYLRLRARAWPMGEAEVVIDLSPTAAHTNVVITEKVLSGPGRFVPPPVREPALGWRNVETLRRLALVATRRN